LIKPQETTIVDLVELKGRLRKYTRAERKAFNIEAAELAAGYHTLCARAPRRTQPYLSKTRSGVAPIEQSGRRLEERLAMALFNRKVLDFKDGASLNLLDYQFPLKSALADHGIGKIDLLGLCADGTLAVIELKVEGNNEDRRIGLLEGLIYAGIVEANLQMIVKQINAVHGFRVALKRPRILLVAPPPGKHENQQMLGKAGRHRTALECQPPLDTDISQGEAANAGDFGDNVPITYARIRSRHSCLPSSGRQHRSIRGECPVGYSRLFRRCSGIGAGLPARMERCWARKCVIANC